MHPPCCDGCPYVGANSGFLQKEQQVLLLEAQVVTGKGLVAEDVPEA